MKTLIVVSHPHLAHSETQAFLKESSSLCQAAIWHHLDEAQPFDVAAERQLLLATDRVIFQFPLYWYQAPASLKAWLDAVWTKQVVYDEQGGKLTGKTLGFVISFSQPATAYQVGGAVGVSLSTLLAPYVALAHKTGLTVLPALQIPQFAYQTPAERAKLLVAYQQYLTLPQPASFDEQAAWWQQQLLAEGDSAALLRDYFSAQQDQLAQLQQTVAELKQGEED